MNFDEDTVREELPLEEGKRAFSIGLYMTGWQGQFHYIGQITHQLTNKQIKRKVELQEAEKQGINVKKRLAKWYKDIDDKLWTERRQTCCTYKHYKFAWTQLCKWAKDNKVGYRDCEARNNDTGKQPPHKWIITHIHTEKWHEYTKLRFKEAEGIFIRTQRKALPKVCLNRQVPGQGKFFEAECQRAWKQIEKPNEEAKKARETRLLRRNE